MRRSTGRKIRSPGAVPPPNTLAMCPPSSGVVTALTATRTANCNQPSRTSQLFRDEERGDQVGGQHDRRHETDDVVGAHRRAPITSAGVRAASAWAPVDDSVPV